MTGRRLHARYLLTQPLEGNLRVREEVTIERWDDDEIVVISPVPSRHAEDLTLELPGTDPRHLQVKVEESRPIVTPDGSLCHRVRLAIQPVAGNGNGRGTS
jgi:hypothetical protein